jgi:predicted ABC-type ATPase
VEKNVALARVNGYRVEANYLYLDPAEGVRRATVRGEGTGRAVPREQVIDTYKKVTATFA